MTVKILSATLTGIEGKIVTVEVDISKGLPSFSIVGLADTAVKESKERVRSAILNSGFEFPVGRITVNLAPADIKKEGALFDLPIAVGILLSSGQIYCDDLDKILLMGELSLSGDIRKIKGVLPIVIEAVERGIYNFVLPTNNRRECTYIKKANIYPFSTLNEVIGFLKYKDTLPYDEEYHFTEEKSTMDFEDVIGQNSCKRALEVAAAGGHNILLFGPPGSGKTMLASRFPTILPQLTYEESLEVTKIYSVSGYLDEETSFINLRPFRNPHYTISKAALIGGGNDLRAGEITLAHNGVLFLDEILEFKKNVLEVLRQPLEEHIVKIARASGTVTYPANFTLIAAMNPCPCGYFLSNSPTKSCNCTEFERRKYMDKLSGPMLDRIDIYSFVQGLDYREINKSTSGENSRDIRKRVEMARNIQYKRFENSNIKCNAQMNKKYINQYCVLDEECKKILQKTHDAYGLSTRAYYKILKLARTMADLNKKGNIDKSDIIEAIQYRKFLNKNII